MDNQNGITYYSLISEYEGDTTKMCGLTNNEVDNNFHFLRGKDITSIDWDKDKCCFIVKKLNGEVIETEAINKYISDSIIAALSGVTEDVNQLESILSAVTDSVEAVYDEIDAQISSVTESFNESYGHFNVELQETNDYLTNYVDIKTEALSQEIKGVKNYINETLCDIRCKLDSLDKRLQAYEEVIIIT